MLQHTKYIHGFREYFFKVSHNKSMEAIDPQVRIWPGLTPGA